MSDTLTNPITGLPVSNEQLAQLSELATRQLRLEEDARKLEEQLSAVQSNIRTLSQETIPDLMAELGMESFKLSDGSAVAIKPFVSAKIPEDGKDRAFAWLRNNGHDAIIKRQIHVALGKGEDKVANKIVAGLEKMHVPFSDKTDVHPMTLKSFCAERVESGDATFPRELFGVFVGKLTKITPPKSK